MMHTLWNDGWQFAKLPLGSGYDDMQAAEKQPVILPHDWLIQNTDALYEDGDGWYIKPLAWQPEWRDQCVQLDFDGVYMDADVLLNGDVICTHHYGYTAFRVDLTGRLRAGENEIAVHIRHQSPNTRWYSGAGIFRDVHLDALPAHHMVPGGYQINTSRAGEGWRLDFDVELSGAGEYPAYRLTDLLGDTLAQGRMEGLSQSLTLTDVQPWSPDTPVLYRLRLTLGDQTEVIPVGFRETRFTPDQGFFLNDQPLKLHGVCLHHDLGAVGAAFYPAAAERQLRLMKEMGVNAIRTSHNPPARQYLDLCDQLGLLVMDELYDMWELPKTTYDNARFFPQTYAQSVAEWVRRDRCHPCVILWSIGNEIYDMQASDRGQYWTRVLMEEVQRHDTRHARVTFGSNYMPWEGAQKCADIVKLPGYNYAEKLYAEHHEKHPDWVIYGSETASLVSTRGVYHFPMDQEIMSDEDLQCSALMNSNTSWGARDLRVMLSQDLNTPYSLGQFIWSGIDYIGEPTPYHTRSSYFGHMDTACFPKDSYYFFQAMWTDRPMVHIGVTWDWNVGQRIDVPVMTNCAAVELLLNGVSLGRRPVNRLDPKACLPVWRVPFAKGTLEARAYDEAGDLVCQTRRVTSGESHSLRLQADRAGMRGGSGEIAFIEVSALDGDGIPVENAIDRVHVKVSGSGVLLGLDNGDSTDPDGYKVSSRRLFAGKLLIMVGAQQGPGFINIEADAPGLRGATLSLPVSKGGKLLFPDLCSKEAPDAPIAIRRIDLCPLGPTALTPENDSVSFLVCALPALAPEQTLHYRVTNAQGIDVPCGEITREGNTVTVHARGDGRMYLRVTADNGDSHARILSTREITAAGFGQAGLDAYNFIAGALCDIRLGDIGAGNEQGIAFARDGESAAGFSHVDFGPVGSDTLELPIFALNGDRYEIGLWDGIPGQGGEKICDLSYQKPSRWNVYQAETYRLPRVLRGEHTLCFSLDQKVHMKGFRFLRQSRALRWNAAGEADRVYGDTFTREGTAVRGIGNNVTLEFDHMVFAGDSAELVIAGATSLAENAIHVRVTGPDGQSVTTLCAFGGSGERRFTVQTLSGECAVAFVFLPGSQFDFEGFRFEEGENQ